MHSSVRTENVRRLLSVGEMRGYSSNQILQLCHLDRSILNRQNVSAEDYSRIYRSIIELLQDECLGFYGHRTVPPGTFKQLCYGVISSRSLQQAITRIDEFNQLYCQLKYGKNHPRKTIENSVSNQYVLIDLPDLTEPNTQQPLQQRVNASMLSGFHGFLNWLIDAYIPLQSVLLCSNDSIDGGKYRKIFDCELTLNTGRNALVFDKVFLQAKIKQNSDTLNSFLSIAPAIGIAGREISANQKTLAGEIERIFQRHINNLPSLPQCADLIGISERTLKRRLQESGQGYQKIKESFRKDLASRYLTDTQLSNEEIALLMGFDDIRNFYKVFKNWYGVSPKAFRESER